jgi:hypothetical protein
MVYFSLVHSIISYGIIFWGTSTYSKIIFKIQKRIIRIITSASSRDSCRDIFKKLYIFPTYVVKNKEFFKTNLEVDGLNTRYNHDLHFPVANLSIFQKGDCYLFINNTFHRSNYNPKGLNIKFVHTIS